MELTQIAFASDLVSSDRKHIEDNVYMDDPVNNLFIFIYFI